MPDSRNKRPSQNNRQRDNSISSVHSVVRNVKLELEHILRHTRGLECFMRFANKEANDEGIRFWAAAHQFRMRFPEEDALAQLSPETRAETMDPITSQAQYIWNTYLKPGAQDEISCSDGVNREGIKQAIDQGQINSDLFSEMQLLALQDIKHNSLSRFRQSPEYTRFLDYLLGELQEPMNRMPSLVVNQAHFDLVLSNPLSRQLFYDYLTGKNASVYLRFISDVEIYREPATLVERKKEALRLFEMYLKAEAANSIRAAVAEEKLVSEVETAIPTGGRTVFDAVTVSVRSFAEKSHFHDFCQTPEFLQLRALLEEYKKLRIETSQKDGNRQAGGFSDESPRGPPSVSRSGAPDSFQRGWAQPQPRPQVNRTQHASGGASRLGFASQDENSGFGYGPRFRDRYAKTEKVERSESSRSRSESSGKREKKEASRSRSGKDAARLAASGSVKSTSDLLREIKKQSLRIQVRDLMELLADQQLVNAYRDFCISEKSEENIMFWIDCEKFRTSVPRMKLTAMAVYRKYLDPDAQYALALSSEWSARVLAKLDACPDDDEPEEDLFVEALQAVAGIMLSDSFPRFMKSRQLDRILAGGKEKEAPATAPPAPGGSCCVVQ